MFLGIITIIILVITIILKPYQYLVIFTSKSLDCLGEITKEEEILLDFIKTNLTNKEGGIYTNYKDSENSGDITKGHSILSESQGIILMYYFYRNDAIGFENTYKFIKENMLLENNLISWRIDEKEQSKTSATIDDLRIVKALLYGSEVFSEIKYKNLAFKISESIYDNLITQDNLIDFKDEYGKSNNTTLCYLDLETIDMLTKVSSKWKPIYENSIELINKSYISDKLPLHKTTYNIETNSFDKKDIDLLLSLIVINNKALVGEDVTKSVAWLEKTLYKKGRLVSTYNEEGEEISNIQSTSIYAMVAELGSTIHNEKLYNEAIKQMKKYQIKNKKSSIYGAFGDENTEEVYSYDNLNALIALRRRCTNDN